jgi:hypothetical protein
LKEDRMNGLRPIIILALALWIAPAVHAKEGGDQYPSGAENWFAGAVPPPGFYCVNYSGYYTGELKNASGGKVNLNGTTPWVYATFEAVRFAEITPVKILGAEFAVHVIVPVVYQSMNLNGHGSTSRVGDITFSPFVLGWHRPRWHVATGLDINLPTGSYNRSDPRVSVGAHYYGFEPALAFSFMPKSGWEASAKLMYNLKTTNQATNYHSGQEFHMDYLAGKHFGGWMFGASGYVLTQVTDDTVGGESVAATPGLWGAGRRGQVFAAGPSAGYTNKRHMTFMAQWQHETLVRNRFGGDKVWFKVIIPAASIFHGSRS